MYGCVLMNTIFRQTMITMANTNPHYPINVHIPIKVSWFAFKFLSLLPVLNLLYDMAAHGISFFLLPKQITTEGPRSRDPRV